MALHLHRREQAQQPILHLVTEDVNRLEKYLVGLGGRPHGGEIAPLKRFLALLGRCSKLAFLGVLVVVRLVFELFENRTGRGDLSLVEFVFLDEFLDQRLQDSTRVKESMNGLHLGGNGGRFGWGISP